MTAPPRPVADVPPPDLADGTAVAHAWLVELIAAAPLAHAGRVPVARLAADGPALCAALLAATGAEAELDRLRPGGDRLALAAGAAELAGAGEPAGAVAAVAALRRALWATLAVDDAALAARLGHVCDVVAQAVLEPPVAEALAEAETPWVAAIARRLQAGGRPLSVLVVEAHDADRLLAAGGRDAASLDAIERAVRHAVRPADAVVRENAGRHWIVADGLDADGARALAEHVASAVASGAPTHGAPPSVAAGLAAVPADGDGAAALAALADERLFAARAAGVTVVG